MISNIKIHVNSLYDLPKKEEIYSLVRSLYGLYICASLHFDFRNLDYFFYKTWYVRYAVRGQSSVIKIWWWQWRTEWGFGVFKPPLPEIPKF
jgi:hypothetical protein